MIPASLPSSLISLAIGAVVTGGQVGTECTTSSGFVGWLPSIVNGGFILPISLACFAIGPKYIFGSETGLIMLLEVLLGPLWVWLVYLEAPSPWTLLGGGALLLVLTLHEVYCLRLELKRTHCENVAMDNDAATYDISFDPPLETIECKETQAHGAGESRDELAKESGLTPAHDKMFVLL
eukprot:TRINITY_DN29372_c0_g1_i1.p1 TRINITY_DN29372_c0_g1~~TRINITY_DN29372_c0_g1_i1.p1  ORF type:complete len:180 (+),score=11.14 TRINITY_DN29372_c0_g1_i1:566-1105(+)